ncbi:MAG TPA: NAD-dependent protein deacetylase [Polyangiaceae bacterium]|nr:NAD-dependent protein deacetylase [Polyangiaceae bacterium]
MPRLTDDADRLAAFLFGRRAAVLTGAGCSTESGIPDYRGEGTRRRATNPIQYREFLASPEGRARYWARSVVGWPHFCRAQPNAGHRALAALQRAERVGGLITQNVDRLHTRAGSTPVVELHGSLHDVRCLGCGALEPRAELQRRLLELNQRLAALEVELSPDGDAELPIEWLRGFRAADCQRCGGVLKPNVVFFGEAVPRDVVARSHALVDRADALLVVGSSLAVYSGFRFVRAAAERRLPIAMVNLGPCRGQELSALQIDARAGELLPLVAARLGAPALAS